MFAALIKSHLNKAEPGKEPQKRPQGTEIAAPEPILDQIQKENAEKDYPYGKYLKKVRLAEGEIDPFQKAIEGFWDSCDSLYICKIKKIKKGADNIVEHRIDTHGKGPDKKGERVEYSCQMKRKERGDKDENKDKILYLVAVLEKLFISIPLTRTLFWREITNKMIKGTKGAYPAAKDPA